MFNLTRFVKSCTKVLQPTGTGCLLRCPAGAQHIQKSLSPGLINVVRTIIGRDPSRIDPAKITLRKGPRKKLRDANMRNQPRRQYKEGDYVYANEVLRIQRSAVQWKAGQYVVTGRNRTLNAQVNGTIKLTTEIDHDKVSMKRDKPFDDVLPDEQKLRTVVHVIPDEQHSRFNLVEQI